VTFIHNDPEFPLLLEAVADLGPLRAAALVEKDYWVTHALWALQRNGFALWFKGGTSLTKAFRITSRFSEDLDLVMLDGTVRDLPPVTSWHGTTARAIRSRAQYWDAVAQHIQIPDATVTLAPDEEETYINPKFRVSYNGHHLAQLHSEGSIIKPYVLLELAHADDHCAIAPAVDVPISSFVHEYLTSRRFWDTSDVINNHADAVACVHPVVTLLEKLDAITRRYHRSDDRFSASTFARHYEDAARIIGAIDQLPDIPSSPRALAEDMQKRGLIRQVVRANDEAFILPRADRRAEVQTAYSALGRMYWVPQMPLAEACDAIRGWIATSLSESPKRFD